MKNFLLKFKMKIKAFDNKLFIQTHNDLLKKLSNKNPAYLEKYSFIETQNLNEEVDELIQQTQDIIDEMELEFELAIDMIEDNLYLLIKTISIIENKPLKQIMKELFEHE